jgi:hypothetical protein
MDMLSIINWTLCLYLDPFLQTDMDISYAMQDQVI